MSTDTIYRLRIINKTKMLFFRRKRSKLQLKVNVSWYQLDPETRELMVYNLGKKNLKQFKIILHTAKDNYTFESSEHIEILNNTLIPLSAFKNPDGDKFSGILKKITFECLEGKAVFISSGNNLKKIK